ncbi:MAG: DUF6048 family protein [Bacteroidales bacterium]|jgi:hypothetical protein|nr:DUF6048 family protein [Bacteroidales bacterium]
MLTLNSAAQEQEFKRKPKRADDFIRMEGLRLGVDLTRPFQSMWTKGDRMGLAFSADVELVPNIFPVVEAGAESYKIDHDYINYNSSGGFVRLGLDYNLLEAQDPSERSTLYVGFRYGLSVSTQQIESYTLNNYWETVSGAFHAQTYGAQWLEGVFGMTGEIMKNLYLGWSIRLKVNVYQGSKHDMPPASFNAGYGKTAKSRFDMTYSLYYTIPFKFHRPEKNAK